MPFHRLDTSSALQQTLQTHVYELQSLSAALSMQEPFAREANAVLPLLVSLAGEALARSYRERFAALMNQYEVLGMPTRFRDDNDRAYLAKVQRFSRDLLAYVKKHHPIELEFATAHAE